MTADAPPGGGTSDAPFEMVDPKLTIYALANGMDLEKTDHSRRLGWFREGFDRGILIEAAADDAFFVSALAWKTGDEDGGKRSQVAGGVAGPELAERLSELLETALEAANGL